ncbi:methylated-DNA--[protein]-cysteine S-methyltransferase [Myroides ceti]|uniref:Methylated-DNA--[protein]-cysteine S-methyltransferase n=1 Tax=Paenimyroides ceti TaxID=395087 RepID=A0ABT8CT36_9FLAO|nr:methylated-DNA--[protein]-cysteine S-methyltransferase [Paenimyroides ceti]MDN3707400.1 methylated-DNA--[protein]-cysteine S-methyltransferase [Paenimyroides ceti]
MHTQENIDYNRIASAIDYIVKNFRKQPDLNEIATEVHLSPAHFQRLFTKWAGTSPKKFLQYISVQYAKEILKQSEKTSLSDAAYQTGLSGTSRLHDLFINIEGMTPAEYKNGGKNLIINYSYSETQFGKLLIASTTKGICYMAFEDKTKEAFTTLQKNFPNATFRLRTDSLQQNALAFFQKDINGFSEIKLHLKGTDFQLKVWESLLKIPEGNLSTYGVLAEKIGHSKASRAVGTAIGKNPVAYLIPCHRVIQSSGKFGGYMWGTTRKTAIIGCEAVKNNLKL